MTNQHEIDELNKSSEQFSLGHSSNDVSELSTEALRQELARRVQYAKAHKEERVKELREIVRKSSLELEQLTGQKLHVSVKEPKDVKVQVKNQKAFDRLPDIVKKSMPKELRQSMENGEDIVEFRQRKEEEVEVARPTAKQSSQDVKNCPECGATPSNWEFSVNDGHMYCVCGATVVEGAGAKGFKR